MTLRKGQVSFDPIRIRPIDNPDRQLRISIDFYTRKVGEEGELRWQILSLEEYNIAEDPVPRFSIYLGDNFTTTFLTPRAPRPGRLLGAESQDINVVSIDSDDLSKWKIAQLWDKIALTDADIQILEKVGFTEVLMNRHSSFSSSSSISHSTLSSSS